MRRKQQSVQRSDGWRGKVAGPLKEPASHCQAKVKDRRTESTHSRRQLSAREHPPVTMPQQANTRGGGSHGTESPEVQTITK